MPEEGDEHFLRDFFRIMHAYAERKDITEKRIAKLLEQLHNLAFNLRRLHRKRKAGLRLILDEKACNAFCSLRLAAFLPEQ